jgi:hypothetical protein
MTDYAGMTVNERLFAAGLLQLWDRAVADRNRETLGGLLSQVGLAHQATEIIDSVLKQRFQGDPGTFTSPLVPSP